MRPLTGVFTTKDYPALLVGLTSPDDAAVYRLDDERAIVSTVDFFPPVVDDPYAFGAIAAANALSDIYAMGGVPLFAMNLVAYPDGLGLGVLAEILRGGAEKVREAGAAIAGGHTITDQEPKYGLAVTGIVNPNEIVTKGGAKPGDALVLTKALGTGVVTTALKNQLASAEDVAAAVQSMSRLNRNASQLAQQHHVHAMTDVTGYSLLGHGHEMAHLSGVDLHLNYSSLQWLPGALAYGKQGVFPGGMRRNADYYGRWIDFDEALLDYECELLFDPQTSGGLLIALPPDDAVALVSALEMEGESASLIGNVTAGDGRIRVSKE